MGDGQEDAALALEEEDGVEKDEREPEVIESARAVEQKRKKECSVIILADSNAPSISDHHQKPTRTQK